MLSGLTVTLLVSHVLLRARGEYSGAKRIYQNNCSCSLLRLKCYMYTTRRSATGTPGQVLAWDAMRRGGSIA